MKLLKAVPQSFGVPVEKPRQTQVGRSYAAAQLGRLVSDWVAQATSADSEVKTSLRKLRDRSRQLGRDNDYVRGFFTTVEDNVIGTGISFQSQIKMLRGPKPNKELNESIELAWARWSKKSNCHTAGKFAFQDIERLVVRNRSEAGEIFVRMIKGRKFGKSKIPFALEIIEADYLDEDKSEILPDGREIRMGVEMDEWGRPLAYHFFQRHPGDYQFSASRPALKMHRRIPAEEIIPIQMFERPNQTRSVPDLVAAIMRLHHMGGYEEAEVIAARATASMMGFIETDSELDMVDGVEYDNQVSDFAPGEIKTLLPGQKFSVPDLHRPGNQFEPFMRMMLKGMAAGVATSYSTVSRDYSQSNFSSSRMDLLNERDHWKVLQQWIIRNFHQVVFDNWLEMAVLSGEVKLPDYELNPEKYEAVKWMPRGWAWIDPLKEINAAKEAIKGGLATRSTVAAQQGEDFEEIVEQVKREKEILQEAGLEFDTDVSAQKAEAGGAPPFGKGKKKPKPTGDEEETDEDDDSNPEDK